MRNFGDKVEQTYLQCFATMRSFSEKYKTIIPLSQINTNTKH